MHFLRFTHFKCNFLAFLFSKENSQNPGEIPVYDYWSEFVNMLLMLGFILTLILITVWTLKKIMRSRAEQLNKSTGIKILERRVLSSKSSIYLVNVLGKGLIIAESPSGIQFLSEFPPETNIELILDQLVQHERPSFRDIIQQKIKKISQRNKPTA